MIDNYKKQDVFVLKFNFLINYLTINIMLLVILYVIKII